MTMTFYFKQAAWILVISALFASQPASAKDIFPEITLGEWTAIGSESDIVEIQPTKIIIRDVHSICNVKQISKKKEHLVVYSTCASRDDGKLRKLKSVLYISVFNDKKIAIKYCQKCKPIAYAR